MLSTSSNVTDYCLTQGHGNVRAGDWFHLAARGADVDALAILAFRLKQGVVYTTALNSVLQDLRVDHAVLQTHALIAAIILQPVRDAVFELS